MVAQVVGLSMVVLGQMDHFWMTGGTPQPDVVDETASQVATPNGSEMTVCSSPPRPWWDPALGLSVRQGGTPKQGHL